MIFFKLLKIFITILILVTYYHSFRSKIIAILNHSREFEFDFWMEQLLIRLYLLFDQTLDYQDLIPIKTKRLTKEYKKTPTK